MAGLLRGDRPIGGGVSSSAALCVATALALLKLTGAELSKLEIAKLAQEAEHHFAGTPGTSRFLKWSMMQYSDRPSCWCAAASRSESLMAGPSAYTVWRYWWTKLMAMAPSPTAEATRRITPWRTSPTAKMPGTLVSSE